MINLFVYAGGLGVIASIFVFVQDQIKYGVRTDLNYLRRKVSQIVIFSISLSAVISGVWFKL